MTDTNERIAALETHAESLLKVADKWDQMLVQVTITNTNLSNLIQQTDIYQRTSQAELTAHGHRLGAAENNLAKLADVPDTLNKHHQRIEFTEKYIAGRTTVWWLIVKIAVAVGGLAGFAAAVVAIATGLHR